MQDHARSAARWLGPAFALGGVVAFAVLWLERANYPGIIAYGVLHTITSYERVLPLLAIGIAFAQNRWRYASAGILLLIVGAVVGWSSKDQILTPLLTRPDAVKYLGYLRLLGPVSCILAGLVLAAPETVCRFLIPPISLLFGAMLGFSLALEDPSLGQRLYILGIGATLLWVILVPSFALQQVPRAWLRTGGRIMASWLFAIGIMLGALKLVPAPRVATPVPPAPASAPEPSSGTDSTAVTHSVLPTPPSWIDQTRQP
jgi:hypothetical protein